MYKLKKEFLASIVDEQNPDITWGLCEEGIVKILAFITGEEERFYEVKCEYVKWSFKYNEEWIPVSPFLQKWLTNYYCMTKYNKEPMSRPQAPWA